MHKSTLVKSEQLGMPFGTAQARLRKAVFFAVLVKHGENICFRCRKPILKADELSLDHKVDWLHDNVNLFWDVENVGFSHIKCNRTGRRPTKKVAPKSMAWCSRCKAYLPESQFSKNAHHWNGLHHYCKKCKAETR